MTSYKELEVWQKSVGLSVEVYRATQRFPPEEKFGLTIQSRRAATSIPANIAEGWDRGSRKEYVQFLLVARGSLMELETDLFIARELAYFTEQELQPLQAKIADVGKMLNRLIQALKKPIN
ncbi:MAG: four helix bundle protein [Terriglobia bacterium]